MLRGCAPSDFIRFVKEGNGGHLDTAVTTYEKDGVQVIFDGAAFLTHVEKRLIEGFGFKKVGLGNRWRASSAGPDKQWATDDDLVVEESRR